MASQSSGLGRAAELLSTLAVASRLEVLAVVQRSSRDEPCKLGDLARATGRSQRDLGKDLAHLQECGLVRVQNGAATADLTPLADAAAAVDATLPVTRLLAAHPDLGQLIRHGRVTTWPENQALLRRIAELAVQLLPRNTELEESEVNELLSQLHPDCATLRRLLVDAGLVRREGSAAYRRVD